MGYIRHHAIIVTGGSGKKIEALRKQVCKIINKNFSNELPDLDISVSRDFASNMITPVIEANVNGYATFFIGPDGSKEGWGASDCGNKSREDICNILYKSGFNFIEISYGDEAGPASIINQS